MSGPYRKVERITVHSDAHLATVLRLAGFLADGLTVNAVLDKIRDVGSYHGVRITIYRDIESIYTIYYTPEG